MSENKLDKILLGVETNATNTARIEKHLDKINGSVAKHNEWINRYDIRVAEEVPETKKKVDRINVKLATVGTLVTVAMTIVYYLIRQ